MNHKSAIEHPEAIDEYIEKEVTKGALLGPVQERPSNKFHWSPMLTRPKAKTKRRVIVDLSFPKGGSVNDMVEGDKYDGLRYKLKLPRIDDIVECIGH